MGDGAAQGARCGLDTSFLIRALVGGSSQDQTLRRWLRSGEPLGISTIAWTEFLCGPLEKDQIELASAIVPRRAPFGEESSRLAAGLFNDSGRRRGSLVDCMIAATAIQSDASLATANVTDFRGFSKAGLRLAE